MKILGIGATGYIGSAVARARRGRLRRHRTRALPGLSKSHDKLAVALQRMGHRISANSVRRLSPALGYSRQSNRKADEGSKHPDRDAQFEHINAKVIAAQAADQPVRRSLGRPASEGNVMWRVVALRWIFIAPVLAGVLVLAAILTPALASDLGRRIVLRRSPGPGVPALLRSPRAKRADRPDGRRDALSPVIVSATG